MGSVRKNIFLGSYFMFSSRFMLFPKFLEEQKCPWGGGGEAFIYFLEKQFFLISCFLRVFYAISNSFRFFLYTYV